MTVVPQLIKKIIFMPQKPCTENNYWFENKKEGFVQGLFIGTIVTFIITFTLWVPSDVKQLKGYVFVCLEKKNSSYDFENARECVAEEFDNVFGV